MVSITPVPGSPQGDANYSMWMCLRNRKGSLFFKAFGASTNLLSKTLTFVELLRSWRLNVAIHLRVVIHSEARSGHIMSIMAPSPSGYVTLRFFVCMPYPMAICLEYFRDRKQVEVLQKETHVHAMSQPTEVVLIVMLA